MRTKLAGFFSILLDQHQAPSRQLTKDWLNAAADGRRNEVTGVEGTSAEARLG